MSVECPECGSYDTEAISGRRGDLSPGEWCLYVCREQECGAQWQAIMPEPPDGYLGDGIFAENH